MSSRGRSPSAPFQRDADIDMDATQKSSDARVVVVTNLTRNVVESHLRTVFGFYGQIVKIDLPTYAKSGQNKGKAALEFGSTEAAQKAASHMDGGQLDGAVLGVELSDLPIRPRSRSRSRSPRPRSPRAPLPLARNGWDRPRSFSRSRSRSRSPPPPRYARREFARYNEPPRRPPPRQQGRDFYRPRSRSPPPRRGPAVPARRRSPSYERGGYGRRGRTRSRSVSYSVRSSRSPTRSFSRSRSRSRSPSYSSYSRSRSRSRSLSRARRSTSRDDIRDSRSRSPVSPTKDV